MDIKEWLGEDNTLGIDIWNKKYRYNNETLDEWFKRVSNGDKDLENLIREKKFLFGGRVLSNRGIDSKSSYFNCYSSGYCPDDLEGILELNKNIALTYKYQGGQGLSMSKVRPKGTKIGTVFESDGIIPFMKIFNQTTESTTQGGSRKGALMISLDIRHKEAENFIKVKQNTTEITKANLSLEVDNEFMQAVKKYYDTGEVVKFIEKRDYNGHIVEYEITPIELYKLLIESAVNWGEPGCLFTDRFRKYNMQELVKEYEIVTSNVCGG